jgi:hypothetical protein
MCSVAGYVWYALGPLRRRCAKAHRHLLAASRDLEATLDASAWGTLCELLISKSMQTM